MISPTIGISTLAHITVIIAVKTKNFLGFKKSSKNKSEKNILLKRFFLALGIALIIEVTVGAIMGTSLLALDAGVYGKESNLKIIKNIINTHP